VRNFATPASRVLGREVRVLFLAQNPVETATEDVLSEACASGRRMGKWLGSSGLMDDSNYFCFFENAWRSPGKCPSVTNLNPSHIWSTIAECQPDVIVTCGKYALQVVQAYMPQENVLEWYHPSGRNFKLNGMSDTHLAWALGHEVDWKVESFYEDVELVARRRAARELFEQALRDAGLLE
jgi:hypothetical protein